MGCGCNKKNTMGRKPLLRTLATRPTQINTTNSSNNIQLQALSVPITNLMNDSKRMDDQRLAAERLRRAAIKKRLNK